ncbi:MAG: hypothetical protein NVSMB1_04290 [Polyangiales bacterium]
MAPALKVLSLRLPGRTVRLGILGGRSGVAIGELGSSFPKLAADAETMRWRSLLEGARVVGIAKRNDALPGRCFQLSLIRAKEFLHVIANGGGITLTSLHSTRAEDDPREMLGGDDSLDPCHEVRSVTTSEGPALTAVMNEAATRYFEGLRAERTRALTRAIDRAIRKSTRRIEAISGDLAKIGEADRLIETAKLLASNASGKNSTEWAGGLAVQGSKQAGWHRRGAKEVVVVDWSSGEPREVTVALDPSRTPKEEADTLFRRAKRMKRGLPVATARLALATDKHQALVSLRALALASETDQETQALERRALMAGVEGVGGVGGRGIGSEREGEASRRPTSLKKSAPNTLDRKPYRVFASGARTIFVGRSAKDNDALTTVIARPHDLWLHALGTTGAHVIVKLEKNEACPPDLLVDAAHLAAHFSDNRGELVVDVQYVARRYVRKPRGTAAGSVVVERGKVMVLRLEPARVTRLLSAEIP